MDVADIKGGEKDRQNYWVLKKDTTVGVNCRNVEGEIRNIWEHTFGGIGVIRKEQQSVLTG